MISLIGKPGDTNARLSLVPRSPLRGYPTLDLPLYYGYKCPYCNNVIQALFKTDQPIDLFAYEETVIINRKREKRYQIPAEGQKDRRGMEFDTFYQSIMLEAGPWAAQRITLLHHVIPYWGIEHHVKETGAGWFEKTKTGDRACAYTGIGTLNSNLLQQVLRLFAGVKDKDLLKLELPETDKLLSAVNLLRSSDGKSLEGTWIKAVGEGGPMVLIDRSSILAGFGYGFRQAVNKTDPFIGTEGT
jgi:hypothetical protein